MPAGDRGGRPDARAADGRRGRRPRRARRQRPAPHTRTGRVLGHAQVAGRQPRWRWRGDVPPDDCVRVGIVRFVVPDAPGSIWLDLALVYGDEAASNRYEAIIDALRHARAHGGRAHPVRQWPHADRERYMPPSRRSSRGTRSADLRLRLQVEIDELAADRGGARRGRRPHSSSGRTTPGRSAGCTPASSVRSTEIGKWLLPGRGLVNANSVGSRWFCHHTPHGLLVSTCASCGSSSTGRASSRRVDRAAAAGRHLRHVVRPAPDPARPTAP